MSTSGGGLKLFRDLLKIYVISDQVNIASMYLFSNVWDSFNLGYLTIKLGFHLNQPDRVL